MIEKIIAGGARDSQILKRQYPVKGLKEAANLSIWWNGFLGYYTHTTMELLVGLSVHYSYSPKAQP